MIKGLCYLVVVGYPNRAYFYAFISSMAFQNYTFYLFAIMTVLLRVAGNAQSLDERSLFLFIYDSEQTASGAGHISFAFGNDSTDLTYYTKYRRHDGGGKKASHLTFDKAFHFDKDSLGLQQHLPCLVIRLRSKQISSEEIERLSDHWNLDEPWTLFNNNCTDAVKRILRATKINPGLAFLISTPNELVEDLVYHNVQLFRSHDFKVLVGDVCHYLKNERNAVPQVLFGKRKKRNKKVEGVCF